jgi:cytochrome b
MTDNPVRVWDPLVRLFHWSLVAAFVTAYLSGDEESLVHVYAGYFIIGLLVFRVALGLIGSRHARFSDFLYSPRRTLQYLGSLRTGKPEHYLGHNPAGGWMVILLLVSLALTSYSGLQVYGLEGHGPLAGGGDVALVAQVHADQDGDEQGERARHAGRHKGAAAGEEFWEELHEFFANFTVFLVVLHVAGVIVASRLHGENLVRAMITGNKRAS